LTRARSIGLFLRDLVIGDDALLFAVVAAGIGITAAAEALSITAWWLLPVGVLLALAVSVLRARRET
jgi:lipopolysaccharide export LptBFGC system permease protein LptF